MIHIALHIEKVNLLDKICLKEIVLASGMERYLYLNMSTYNKGETLDLN